MALKESYYNFSVFVALWLNYYTGRNISAWKATGKSQSKKPFLLLGGQGIGVNNGGSGPKAQYFAAGGQYECSAWRANSIRKWIFTDV